MSSRRSRLPAVVLILLAPTLLQATPARPAAPALAERSADRGLLARVWNLLSVLWAKNGSGADPSGMPAPQITGDNGSGLDPSGHS